MKRIVRVRGIIPHEGKYLFVRNARGADYWALPGGHLEPDETLVDGLSREIEEELGVVPVVGDLKYVQQLFIRGEESLEFFFEITNGQDYTRLDLAQTTHGSVELAAAEFIDPSVEHVLPEFLAELSGDMPKELPTKVFVRRVS